MLPTWMAVPYLITAFGGLLLSNNLSVYSAGLTTLTLGLKVKRVYAVVVDIVAIFAGSIYFMLIADSFYGPFITFISLLAVPITAWVGIFVVDLIHRHYYSPKDLLDVSPSSAYWYRGGIEWRAFGAWAIAIVLGFSFTTIGTTADKRLVQGFPVRLVAGPQRSRLDRDVRGGRRDLLCTGRGERSSRRAGRECSCLRCCTPARSSSTWSWPWTNCPKRAVTCWRSLPAFEAGGGFNVMAAAQRNGLPVVYLGRHGTGRFGDLAREAMNAEGIRIGIDRPRRSATPGCAWP